MFERSSSNSISLSQKCSNCRKLLREGENKTAAQPSGIESEVILQMGNMSLISVNNFRGLDSFSKKEFILTDVLIQYWTLLGTSYIYHTYYVAYWCKRERRILIGSLSGPNSADMDR